VRRIGAFIILPDLVFLISLSTTLSSGWIGSAWLESCEDSFSEDWLSQGWWKWEGNWLVSDVGFWWCWSGKNDWCGIFISLIFWCCSLCPFAFTYHKDSNITSFLQVAKSSSNRQWNWGVTRPVRVIKMSGTLLEWLGEWYRICLLWYCLSICCGSVIFVDYLLEHILVNQKGCNVLNSLLLWLLKIWKGRINECIFYLLIIDSFSLFEVSWNIIS